MRQTIIASVFLLGLLAGCTSRDEQSPRTPELTDAVEMTAAARFAPGIAAAARTGAPGIAAMPDRGQLVAFRRDVAPRRSVAYTWRPVDISEAHALHAIGGELVVTAPDGRPRHLRYERHIEHADGNWTWVGRPADGVPGGEAIITFGEKAVFGTIPTGTGSPLRITTGGGRIWMMETDDGAIASLPAAHPSGTDALLPPVRGSRSLGASRRAASLGAEAATSESPTVDLMIGYTAGFATRLGGQSQANTRLVNLVDITNQAYANSQIAGRVRLVKTMQVSYPDATANSAALYALTGCTETACTQVDPALQPLHVAREQYGADAISLVRNFNDPENGGCGIAWLIGGGQTPISSTDEYAAMSVVSDTNGMGGSASFPDNGFVCRDETLAHELGHNMGSAHDVATAQGDDGALQVDEYGRYPYSFGYKTDLSAGNFYTVMAYGDAGQTRYRVFSNPQVTYCGGRPCGVANQADNARSLRETMPIIASFLPDQISKRFGFDLNADGRTDMVWFNGSLVCAWLMNGATPTNSCIGASPPTTTILDSGDVDADGRDDLIVDTGTTLQLWAQQAGGGFLATHLASYDQGYVPFRIGDYNGDGTVDIGWRVGDYICVWGMRGVTVVSSKCFAGPGATYQLVSTGDFNNDGYYDLAFGNGTNLNLWLNQQNGLYAVQQIATYDGNWRPNPVGDVNGDGNEDMGWVSGQYLCVWYMSAYNITGQSCYGSIPENGRIIRAGDFDGNGRADLLWANGSIVQMWLKNAQGYYVPAHVASYSAPWTPY